MNCPKCAKPMMLWQSSFKPFSWKCLSCGIIVVETQTTFGSQPAPEDERIFNRPSAGKRPLKEFFGRTG